MTQIEMDRLRLRIARLRAQTREATMDARKPDAACAICGKVAPGGISIVRPPCMDCAAAELDAIVGYPVAEIYRRQLESEKLVARLMYSLAVRTAGKKKEKDDEEKTAG